MANGKVAVATSAIRNRRDRAVLEARLREIGQLKAQQEQIKLRLDEIQPEVAALLTSNGVEKVTFEGLDHMVYNGTNVSISQDRLATALMNHAVDVETAKAVMAESIKRTPYTTITTTAAKPAPVAGGLTG